MKKYNIEKSKYNLLKVDVTDDYGYETTVYEKNIFDASKFIVNYWMTQDKRQEERETMCKTIQKLIELDEQSGILKGNRDGLD
tara:strand:+ start:364 stop:612 length:249 start_codon:yes stop_codon:yes gene_type:complete